MSNLADKPPDLAGSSDRWFGKLKSWFVRSSVPPRKADDCLPSGALDELREKVIGRPLPDDVAEMISAALDVGERIRSHNLYIEDALTRLQFVILCALQEKPQLILARDEL